MGEITRSLMLVDVAKVCHHVNKSYCESIGDLSQAEWEDAEEWQKQSALNGVKYHYRTGQTTPEDSHKSWLAEKEKDGWKYGEIKDVVKKEHPCFVPYSDLPKEEKAKDYIFKAIVDSLSEYINEN